MKLLIDSEVYFLEFRHSYSFNKVEDYGKGLGQHPFSTDAILYKGEINTDNIVCAGCAYCHPKDQFSRAVGRKLALTKALTPVDDPDIVTFTKDQRRQIWEAYWKSGAAKQ